MKNDESNVHVNRTRTQAGVSEAPSLRNLWSHGADQVAFSFQFVGLCFYSRDGISMGVHEGVERVSSRGVILFI